MARARRTAVAIAAVAAPAALAAGNGAHKGSVPGDSSQDVTVKIKDQEGHKGSPDVEDDKRTVTGTINGKRVGGKVLVEGLCSVEKEYSPKR